MERANKSANLIDNVKVRKLHRSIKTKHFNVYYLVTVEA